MHLVRGKWFHVNVPFLFDVKANCSHSKSDFVRPWSGSFQLCCFNTSPRVPWKMVERFHYHLTRHNYYSLIPNAGLLPNGPAVYRRVSTGPNILTDLSCIFSFCQSINPFHLEQPVSIVAIYWTLHCQWSPGCVMVTLHSLKPICLWKIWKYFASDEKLMAPRCCKIEAVNWVLILNERLYFSKMINLWLFQQHNAMAELKIIWRFMLNNLYSGL